MKVEEVCKASVITEKAQKACRWIPRSGEKETGEPKVSDFNRVKNRIVKELSVEVSAFLGLFGVI